jgi:geranylgeranylglycerol-phosphate geranylgeranyltransferase
MLRPRDSIIAFVATLIGARLSGIHQLLSPEVLWIATSNMLLIAASMAFNDWHDVKEDAINRPSSPIASGRISRRSALLIAAVLFCLAIAPAFVVSRLFGLLACVFSLLSMSYTVWLKSYPFLGNSLVALLSSYAFWCWLIVQPHPGSTYAVTALGLALFCLGREILGTARDLPGDAAFNIQTVATTRGGSTANKIGAGCIVMASLAAWLPLWRHETNWIFPLLLAGIYALIFALCLQTLRLPRPSQADAAGRLVNVARWITLLMAIAFAFGVNPSPAPSLRTPQVTQESLKILALWKRPAGSSSSLRLDSRRQPSP